MLQKLNVYVSKCLIFLQQYFVLVIGLIIILLNGCTITTSSQANGFSAPWFQYGSYLTIASNGTGTPNFCVDAEHTPFVNKINEAAEGIYYFAYSLAQLGTEKLNGTDKLYESLYYSVSPNWNDELKAMNAENKSTNSDKVWKLRFPPHDAVQFPTIARLEPRSQEYRDRVNRSIKYTNEHPLYYRPRAIYNFKLRSDDEIEFLVLYRSKSIYDQYIDSYVFKRSSDGRWRFQSHGQEGPMLWTPFFYKFEDTYPEGYPVPRLAHMLKADVKGLAWKGYSCNH